MSCLVLSILVKCSSCQDTKKGVTSSGQKGKQLDGFLVRRVGIGQTDQLWQVERECVINMTRSDK